MPKRFIRLGTACYVNPWSTAGVSPVNGRPEWSVVLLHSGETVTVDASVEDTVARIEDACKEDDAETDAPLAAPLGYAR